MRGGEGWRPTLTAPLTDDRLSETRSNPRLHHCLAVSLCAGSALPPAAEWAWPSLPTALATAEATAAAQAAPLLPLVASSRLLLEVEVDPDCSLLGEEERAIGVVGRPPRRSW